MRITKAKAWVLALHTLESQLSWEKAPCVYSCCVAAWALCIIGFLTPCFQSGKHQIFRPVHRIFSNAAMCDGLIAAEVVHRSTTSLQSDVGNAVLSRR